MPIDKKPTEANLSKLLEELLNAKIEFILVGGLAAVVQGAPITTVDVDIVHHQSPENISKLLTFLHSLNTIHRRPDEQVLEPTERDLSGKGHALFTTRLGPLDVLAMIEGDRNYEDLLEDITEIEFKGQIIQVLDLKKIVEIKRASPHPKDKQRLPIFEETLRQIELQP